MKKEEKSIIINQIAEMLSGYNTVYVTDISGLTVEKSNELRRICFKKGIQLKMVKNTFLKRAFEQLDTDYSQMYEALHGTSAIMLADTGNAPAKLVKEFRGKESIPAIKAAYIEETVYLGDNQLDFLCSIKSKGELIGDLVALLQSPARNVISALQSGGGKLAGIVKTLSER
ncbi:MAG: 50S ribosomal protein L10 [Bacteroidales bacterium]|jgi:large subunit ribosomal protein L10|nr:50S ribosomal protein L10 [Bacteroidales bacterium]